MEHRFRPRAAEELAELTVPGVHSASFGLGVLGTGPGVGWLLLSKLRGHEHGEGERVLGIVL